MPTTLTVQFTSLAAIATYGFSTTSPEYLAAEMYFAQNPQPQYLWLGRQDLTAIGTATLDVGGTGYAVGDIFAINQSGATYGQGKVTGVSSGVVTTFAIIQQGTAYSVASALTTTALTGGGSGLEINITAIGETALQALTACRASSASWWGCYVTDAAAADHEAIVAYVQAMQPQGFYFFTTSDVSVFNPNTGVAMAAGNVLTTLAATSANRYMGIYSTTQSGTAPMNAYIGAGAMGVAMGLNTGLAGSYFTMKFKQIVNASPEPLPAYAVSAIEAGYGNCYLSYANAAYKWLEQGSSGDGYFLDQVLGLDMLSSDLQFSLVDLLISNPSIPQTNAGQTLLINAANAACARSAARGFIAPGTWNGVTVLNVSAGTALPTGFSVQSPSYSTQSPSANAARQSMPLYITIIEAGAVHSIVVQVTVQQ